MYYSLQIFPVMIDQIIQIFYCLIFLYHISDLAIEVKNLYLYDHLN